MVVIITPTNFHVYFFQLDKPWSCHVLYFASIWVSYWPLFTSEVAVFSVSFIRLLLACGEWQHNTAPAMAQQSGWERKREKKDKVHQTPAVLQGNHGAPPWSRVLGLPVTVPCLTLRHTPDLWTANYVAFMKAFVSTITAKRGQNILLFVLNAANCNRAVFPFNLVDIFNRIYCLWDIYGKWKKCAKTE